MEKSGERRTEKRIDSEFWVSIKGLDESRQLRPGNISRSGFYFVTDCSTELLEQGSLQWLEISSADNEATAALMARVVRTFPIEEEAPIEDEASGESSGQRFGLALEFMPRGQEERSALDKVVQQVVTLHLQQTVAIQVDRQFGIRLEHKSGEFAALPIELFQSGPPPHGTEALPAPGDLLRLHNSPRWGVRPVVAEVLSVSPENEELLMGCRLELRIVNLTPEVEETDVPRAGSGSFSIADAVDNLFDDLVDEGNLGPPKPTEHLKGVLSRIQLPSLLALIEIERMTGSLELHRAEQRASVFAREGRVVDVELPGAGDDPREMLAKLCAWRDGTFEFSLGPIDREDRLETSITGLLLDIAREQDEAGR